MISRGPAILRGGSHAEDASNRNVGTAQPSGALASGHGHAYSVKDGDNWVEIAMKDGWKDPWG